MGEFGVLLVAAIMALVAAAAYAAGKANAKRTAMRELAAYYAATGPPDDEPDESEPDIEVIDGFVQSTDDDTGDVVAIPIEQPDPARIEGVLVAFEYASEGGEVTVRGVLGQSCWRHRDLIYLRGHCTLAGSMRTFRADRMSEMVCGVPRRQVEPIAFLTPYAVDDDPYAKD